MWTFVMKGRIPSSELVYPLLALISCPYEGETLEIAIIVFFLVVWIVGCTEFKVDRVKDVLASYLTKSARHREA